MRYATLVALVALITITAFIALACDGGESAQPTPRPIASLATSTPSPGEITLPIERAPGAVTKVTYAPGEEIKGIRPDPTGFRGPDGAVFFMDTETGEIEGWYVADADSRSSCSVRENDRFVVCGGGIGENRTAYLVDRESSEAYQWNPDAMGLLATWPSGLVFEEADPSGAEPTRRFTITNEALQTVSTFDVPHTTDRNIPASILPTPLVVLPDESGLALLVDRSLYLVDVASGSSQLISEIPQTDRSRRLDPFLTRITPSTEGFTVIARFSQLEKTESTSIQGPSPHVLVRRYSGDGRMISEWSLDGKSVRFSPDGKLMAWEDSLHWDSVPILGPGMSVDWPVVMVADADTGEPRFRVKGAALCYGDTGDTIFSDESAGRRWLADSSGILVATKSGFRIAEVTEPDLRLAPLVGVGQYVPFFEPSPVDPDLFAISSKAFVREGEGEHFMSDSGLVDADGNSRWEVVLAPSAGGLGHLTPWGSSGSEVRFNIPHPDHHGGAPCGVGVTPPPKIEFPPFDDDIRLKVTADGDCLNLRDLPLTAANVVTCLPDETSVTVTEVALTEVPGNFESIEPFVISVSYSDGNRWAQVRTEAGQEGWVSSEFLDWAE